MKRYQFDLIKKDLAKKMVLLVGPRQAGKTYLAQQVAQSYTDSVYLNFDSFDDREIIKTQSWLPTTRLLVLDELHKMPEWKNYLKGFYDTKPETMHVLVTGSARMNTFHNMGDSLAGRYFIHHLLPVSPAELKKTHQTVDLRRLITRSGFPEPYLALDPIDSDRWRMQYTNSMLTTDVFEFDKVQNINAMRLIFNMLQRRVGSSVSYQSIAEDISVSPHTVKKYIEILEALYIVFKVTPFSKNIERSIKKEPKVYFFDTGLVQGDEGLKAENLTAVCLLKHVLALNDYQAKPYSLHYIRTKDKREVDFALANDGCLEMLIEVKNQRRDVSVALRALAKQLQVEGIQVVHHLQKEFIKEGIRVLSLKNYLESLYM